jgi:ribose transport system substrate-binding protein
VRRFIAENVEPGANVLMLRILPGVDVLETRYSAGRRILDEAGLNVVGAEFTDGDNAKTKSIVEDYLQRGTIDAVWMDAGATPSPPSRPSRTTAMTCRSSWARTSRTSSRSGRSWASRLSRPTYPTYQWRTPIIAAVRVLQGEPVPGPEWVLPQPAITAETSTST